MNIIINFDQKWFLDCHRHTLTEDSDYTHNMPMSSLQGHCLRTR